MNDLFTLESPTWRQSMINMYQRCPKSFEFRYIKGIKSPPSGALTVGISTHAGIARNLIVKKENGVGCSPEELKDTVATDFEIRAKDTQFEEDEKPGELKDVAIQCALTHQKEIAPQIQPEGIEEQFIIDTDAGYQLCGTMDLTSKDGVIHDAKTAGKAYSQDAIQNSTQAALYDFAFEALHKKRAKAFRFDVLIKPTKTLGVRAQVIEGSVSDGQRAWLFETLSSINKAVKVGAFPPTSPDSWVCSKKFCGYWDMCRGKKN